MTISTLCRPHVQPERGESTRAEDLVHGDSSHRLAPPLFKGRKGEKPLHRATSNVTYLLRDIHVLNVKRNIAQVILGS